MFLFTGNPTPQSRSPVGMGHQPRSEDYRGQNHQVETHPVACQPHGHITHHGDNEQNAAEHHRRN
jgi:hypothetical protein